MLENHDISISELENAVREIAAENPDFVYQQTVIDNGGNRDCVYFDEDGCPSCLIGHGLAKLGVVKEDMVDSSNFMAVGQLFGASHGAESVRWLSDVQFFQDGGYPWGKAVESADVKRETVCSV